MNMKTCSRCKNTKDISQFSPRKISKDGYRGTCKGCMADSCAKYRNSNKGIRRAREYREDTKEKRAANEQSRYRARKRELHADQLATLMASDTSREEWRDVVGFESIYQVSSMGRVRRIAPAPGTHIGKILAPSTKEDGYLQVHLNNMKNKRTACIQVLVAESFIGRREGLEVNHRNGDKTDNSVDNLELVTHDENIEHAVNVLSAWANKNGEDNSNSILTEEDVINMRKMSANGASVREIANVYDRVCYNTVRLAVRGLSWSHID